MRKVEVEYLLDSNKFQFAKTMKNIPHEYTVRKNWLKEQDFVDVVLFIRKHGRSERFWRKEYIYYYYKGFKYWTMGSPIEQTIIINRAKV